MEEIKTFTQFRAVTEEFWNNPSEKRNSAIKKALAQLAKNQELENFDHLYYADASTFKNVIEQTFEKNGKTAKVEFSPYKTDYYAPYDDDCNYGTILTIMVDGQPKLEIDFYHNIYLSTTRTHIPTEIEIDMFLQLTNNNWNKFALTYPFVQDALWEALRQTLCKNKIKDFTLIQKMISENNNILAKLKNPYFVANEIANREEQNKDLIAKLKALEQTLDEIDFKLE